MGNVEGLLEVMAEREVEERPVIGTSSMVVVKPALDDGQIADGQVPVQVVHVGTTRRHLGLTVVAGRSGAGHDDHAEPGNLPPGCGTSQ